MFSRKIWNLQLWKNLTNLTKLVLFKNKISKIEGIKELSKLEEVNLIFNDLDRVPVFPSAIKTLSICFNPNLKIESGDLNNLQKLEILRLKANNIKSLPNGFLTHMEHLKEIKLGYWFDCRKKYKSLIIYLNFRQQ